MFIKQQETFENAQKKTLDTHKTLYVVTYIKNIHHILFNVAIIYSCVIPQELQVAIVKFLLVKSHEFSKILVKSEQSLKVKSPGFAGLQIRVIINNCHGLNIMCLIN